MSGFMGGGGKLHLSNVGLDKVVFFKKKIRITFLLVYIFTF